MKLSQNRRQNNLKENTKKLLSRLAIPLWLLALLCLDLLFRKTYGYVGGKSWQDLTALLFTGLWLLLFGGLALLLPRWGGRILILLTTLLSCLLTVVHAVMYHLFGNFFGFPDLLYAGDGAAFFSFRYLQMRKLLLAGVLLTLAAGILAAVFLPKHRREKKMVWRRVIAGALMALLAAGGLHWQSRSLTVEVQLRDEMGWSVALQEEEQSGTPEQIAYSQFKNPNVCLPLTGLYQYTARDLAKTFFSSASQDKAKALERLEAWHDARVPHADNAMTGALRGKNLIMIMVESLDTWMLREDVTPNLCALRDQSVDLIHHYTPLYLNAGTFSTEFSSLTGIIPPMSGVSTDAYVENSLPAALPRLFAREGYRVNSFHAANATIYNRGAIHKNLGFEEYHNHVMMGMENYYLDSQMLNGFDQMVSDREPFFSFIITYSGHGPYDETMDVAAAPHLAQARAAVEASGIRASADTLEQYTRALAQIMETDAFIGGLMEKLEAAGLAENTAIIVYGDHYGKYLTDTDFLLELKGVENRNLLCNTPLLIWSKDLEPRKLEKYTATVDLFPTICNLFGLEVDLRCFVGEDAFSQEGGVVYWRDSSVWDGKTYLDGTQTAALSPEQRELVSRAHAMLELSWSSFQYDWFSVHDPLMDTAADKSE